MSLVPRAGAIRDTVGIIKMVADAGTEEVLGVAMVGHTAGEVIHEAAMARRFHAKITDFLELLHVYPKPKKWRETMRNIIARAMIIR